MSLGAGILETDGFGVRASGSFRRIFEPGGALEHAKRQGEGFPSRVVDRAGRCTEEHLVPSRGERSAAGDHPRDRESEDSRSRGSPRKGLKIESHLPTAREVGADAGTLSAISTELAAIKRRIRRSHRQKQSTPKKVLPMERIEPERMLGLCDG